MTCDAFCYARRGVLLAPSDAATALLYFCLSVSSSSRRPSLRPRSVFRDDNACGRRYRYHSASPPGILAAPYDLIAAYLDRRHCSLLCHIAASLYHTLPFSSPIVTRGRYLRTMTLTSAFIPIHPLTYYIAILYSPSLLLSFEPRCARRRQLPLRHDARCYCYAALPYRLRLARHTYRRGKTLPPFHYNYYALPCAAACLTSCLPFTSAKRWRAARALLCHHALRHHLYVLRGGVGFTVLCCLGGLVPPVVGGWTLPVMATVCMTPTCLHLTTCCVRAAAAARRTPPTNKTADIVAFHLRAVFPPVPVGS